MLGGSIRPVYASGECEIDLARREIRLLGSAVPIGGRAFEIIEVLAQSAGELVTKDELMDRIWPGMIVMENTLHVHTAAARKALGPYRELLKTESRRGYRLLGRWAVRRHDEVTPRAAFPGPRGAGDARATNFPQSLTRLVGRSAAVQRLQDLVSAYRVVTLTGPGGIGKTSLALKVARRVLGEFGDGGWFVELGSLSDPALVPSAVARALGLTLAGDEISAEAVARSVGAQQLLLVLDNCEHVIDAVAILVEMFVRLCPRTTILATSREVFRIEGEHVYRVPPLDVPTSGHAEPERILGHSAVELFIARAQALDSSFSPQADSLQSIATICRQLDGIPLAIEFAAARAAALGIEAVAARLGDRFALLTTGRRTAVPRHQTLRAALDWSYELLPEAERLLLRWLAIFPAGFTIDAAAAVMHESGYERLDVVDGIVNLVAKSLFVLDRSDGQVRWSLLETTRSYALEKLTSHGEAESAARCHARYFRDRFVAPAAGFKARVSKEELARHGREIDNVRAALDWSLSATGDKTIGVDLTVAYAPVWMSLSLMGECCERCERALASLAADPAANSWPRMWLRIALGSALVTTMGSSARAQTVLLEALEIADGLDDLDAQARALSGLAAVYSYRGEYREARTMVERLRQVALRIGEPAIAIVADRVMGTTLLTAGRPREAQECLERVLQSPSTPDDQRRSNWRHSEHRAMARAMLARALWLQGFINRAHAEARASVEELQGAGHHLALCRVLYYGIGRITAMTGEFGTAEQTIARLVEVATHLNAPFWLTAGRFLEGKLMVERGDFADGLRVLRDALDICRRTGWRISYPEFKGAFASALAGVGQLSEALDAVNDAIASAGRSDDGQRWYVPELLRMKGDVLLRHDAGGSDAAGHCYDQAATMAREQGALFWRLRAALSLARLRVAQGRRGEARQALGPVYDQFTEGFGAADLRAARAMLDALPAG
jgi:predicted ATPase/DNA-binding winged helix-turn-helix (wHTH) protein